ncbi:hypothetical protein FGG08_003127 [Glutinoglossum americanum]|uniref:peptidylprolyl isomerase n=1 Tax=Glutinoglossum americanum TaxID=1670608 RepID=A0A9P8IAA7_9PEZI|nr:hypothetical protein FGG08_003127 [Glutinoglossum americanum]
MSVSEMILKDILFEIEQDKPREGDTARIEYTCWREDSTKPGKRGAQVITSEGSSDFEAEIGNGNFLTDLEEALVGMTLGEKSTLTISKEDLVGMTLGERSTLTISSNDFHGKK